MSLQEWPRPYYQPLPFSALLFYVVPVPEDAGELPVLSQTKYQVERAELRTADMAQFCEGPLWEDVKEPLASQIRRSRGYLVRRQVLDQPNLNYLRDARGMVDFLLDNGGLAVYDPQVLKWWTPEEWRAAREPQEQVVILFSEPDWYHTRGMRKFARPDLSWRTPPVPEETVVEVFERFIDLMVLGAHVEEGSEIVIPNVPAGYSVHWRGSVDDPDFNNCHLAIEKGEPSQ